MKKHLKGFILGILTTLLLFSAVSAAPYLKMSIEVFFNTLTTMIEGEDQGLNPFLYEGETYVPIRGLANIMGYDVIWDGENRLVQLISEKENKLEDSIRAYNRAFYDDFFPSRDWQKGFDHYSSALEPYGERATIAWSMGHYLESEVLMYKATKDPLYLNRIIDVMDKILDLRDSEVGRVNEYGENPPIWSAGSRYGWGKSVLKNENGEEVVEVLTYGTWEVNTGIVGEFRNSNDDTYITVLEGSTEGTFQIKVENERKDFNRIYDELKLEEKGIILDDESVRITVLKASDGLPEFQGKEYIGNILTTRAVHTGLLFTPMIQLAEAIKKENLNEYYQQKVEVYLEAAIEAIEYHEGDWVDIDDQKGYYSDAIRGDEGKITPLPWNQMFEPGRMLIGLYKATGKKYYKEKAEKMISYFKDNLEYDQGKDLYIWKYWNWDGYAPKESVNYAILDITFIYEAYQAGIGFSEEDMNRFVNTYRKNVYRDEDTIANLIDGSGNYKRDQWLTLARVNFLSEWGDNYFFYKPITWIEEDGKGGAEDVVKLVSIARSIYQKRIMNPGFEDVTDQGITEDYRNN